MNNSQISSSNEYNGIKVYCDKEIGEFYPERKRNSHKGTYGSANIIAGSDAYIGAAALAVEAALKSGCGYVKLTTSEKVKFCLAAKFPQVIYCDEPDFGSQAIAVGMGSGVNEQLYEQIKLILSQYNGKLLIDADGLNCIAKYGTDVLLNKKCGLLLTPHAKEFSRLTKLDINCILQNPVQTALEFASKYGVTVLLKGADSIITDGNRTALNRRGTTALAKGGSGDMLSGYICGCAARGLDLFDAAVCAAYTMGVAAEISSEQMTDYCATAKDILKNLPKAVKYLT